MPMHATPVQHDIIAITPAPRRATALLPHRARAQHPRFACLCVPLRALLPCIAMQPVPRLREAFVLC